MNYQIKYFKDYVPFQIEETHPVQELLSKHCPAVESEEAEVKRALAHPIDSQKLSDIVKPGEKIVIITSDVTRPVPSWVNWKKPIFL